MLKLEVAARMTVDELRDAIARSKRASIDKIVTDAMSRNLLKAICEACGLDASGKEKQPLVARIITAANGEGNGNGNSNVKYIIDPEASKPSVARDSGAAFALTNPTGAPKKAQARSTPRRSAGGASDDIAAYQHDDKRKNNPPAGLAEFDKPPPQPTKRYQYDPHLDPQLTWAGKAEHTSFEVDTVSLHIHERVSPEAILRAVKREDVQGDLFARFELPDAKAIDFYQHDVGWANRLILGDSLLVMNSLLEREQMAGKIQMIYVDPPYGVKFNSNFQPSLSKRDVRDGDDASLTREPEQIQAYRDTWTLGIHSYLTYLRDRLLVSRELLSPSGSIFIQISDENLHHVRELLDEVFDAKNCFSIIAFVKTTGATARGLSSTLDYLLWYARDIDQIKYHQLYLEKEYGGEGADKYDQIELRDGTRRPLSASEKSARAFEGRVYCLDNLMSQSIGREKGLGAASWFPVKLDGREYLPNAQSRWKTNEEGMAPERADRGRSTHQRRAQRD